MNNTPAISAYKPYESQQQTRIEPVTKQPDYQSMKDEAVYDYQNLNWERSEAMFQKLINENTSNDIQAEALIYLGAIYYQKGNISAAEHYFKQAKNMSLLTYPSSSMFPPKMIDFYRSVKND